MQRVASTEHVWGQNTFKAETNRKRDKDNKYELNKRPAVVENQRKFFSQDRNDILE